jgi:hypothetical protein
MKAIAAFLPHGGGNGLERTLAGSPEGESGPRA